MGQIVKEIGKLITFIDRGSILRVKAVSENRTLYFIAEENQLLDTIASNEITTNTIRFYTRPRHLKYPNVNFIEKGYAKVLGEAAAKLGVRKTLYVRENNNNIVDFSPFTSFLYEKIGARERRKEIFNMFLGDMNKEFFTKNAGHNNDVVFLISSDVHFRFSYLLHYLNAIDEGIVQSSNVYIAYKDSTSSLKLINVHRAGDVNGSEEPINYPRIRSIYKRSTIEATTHLDRQVNDEEIKTADEIVKDEEDTKSVITPEVKIEVRDKIKELKVPEFAGEMIEKAVDRGMVSPKKLDDKTKKNLDEIYFKSLVSAISDANTTNDLRTYDRKKFDKIVKERTDINNVKEVTSSISHLVIDKPKVDKRLEKTEPQTVQHVTSNTLREQYREKLLDRDIESMLMSLDKNPDMPLFFDRVEKEEFNDGLNIYDINKFVMKNLDGKEQVISINIPKLVDGKYYVIDGNRYVMYNQMVAKPVVKIKNDTVALTTSYNKSFIFRFGEKSVTGKSSRVLSTLLRDKSIEHLVHRRDDATEVLPHRFLNYDVAPIFQIIRSLQLKDHLLVIDKENWKFDEEKQMEYIGSSTIDNNGETLWVDREGTVFGKDEEGNYHSKQISLLDFIIDNIGVKIFKTNPKNVYSRINIIGRKLPLITTMMCHTSLLDIMKLYGTKYMILPKDERYPEASDNIVITFSDLKLVIFTTRPSEQLLYNPLKSLTRNVNDVKLSQFFSVTGNPVIYGALNQSVVNGARNSLNNLLDPITLEQLEKDMLPTEIIELLLYINSMLVDNRHKSVNDMNVYRVRNEEAFAAIIYRTLSNEVNRVAPLYRRNKRMGKISINPDFLIRQMATELPNVAPLSSSNPYYEIDELSKITYSGFLGLNSSRSATVDLRLPHESHKGIIDSNAVTDNEKVGLIKYLPLNYNLTNLRGNIEPIPDSEFYKDHTKGMSMNMALDVGVAAHSDSSRVAMAAIQARHLNPINNFYDKPLLRTGVEDALGETLSSDWLIRSHLNGKITKIAHDYIVINGKERVDIRGRILRNSSAGFYHSHNYSLKEGLVVGSELKEGDIIAYNDGVFKDGVPTLIGKYLRVCLAPRSDLMEDASILSSNIADQAVMNYVHDKEVVVNPNETILNVVSIGDSVNVGDVLLETKPRSDDEDFSNSPLFNELADVSNKIFSKTKGYVTDIKFYSNREEMSETEIALYTKLKKSTSTSLETDKKVFLLPKDSRILGRKLNDSIVVHIFIQELIPGKSGSKITMQSAKSIYSVKETELMPKTVDGEEIDLMMSSFSFITRMNPSVLINGYLSKIIHKTVARMKSNTDMAENRKTIELLINNIHVGKDKEHARKSEITRISSMSDTKLRRDIMTDNFHMVVKPFSEPTMEDIISLSEIMDVPLEEYVYYPDQGNMVSESPTPVLYIAVKFLNQITAKGTSQSHKVDEVNSETGQLTQKAKVRQFSVDESLNMFSYGVEDSVLPEFTLYRSDDREAFNSMERQIVERGEVSISDLSTKGQAQAANTLGSYLLAAGYDNNIHQGIKLKIDGKSIDTRG